MRDFQNTSTLHNIITFSLNLMEHFRFLSVTGLPQSGEKFWKMKKIFQVREKSGNYIFSQGNLKKMKKVVEKSGNFKIFLKRC